jgi:hypothetical protein
MPERRRRRELRLASLGQFPAPSSVLFTSPIVTAELLALHRRFHNATLAFAASCRARYLPEHLGVHTTLGEEISSSLSG